MRATMIAAAIVAATIATTGVFLCFTALVAAAAALLSAASGALATLVAVAETRPGLGATPSLAHVDLSAAAATVYTALTSPVVVAPPSKAAMTKFVVAGMLTIIGQLVVSAGA